MTEDQRPRDRPEAEVYRSRPSRAEHYDEGEEVSFVRLFNLLLRHRWKIVVASAATAFLVVGLSLVWPDSYTSEASFVAESGSGISGQIGQLSGMAAQFGIDVPAGQAGQSPQFYADLVTSRRLLEEAVTSSYSVAVGSPTGADSSEDETSDSASVPQASSTPRTLVQLYGIEAETREEAVVAAAERLEDAISVSTNTETGVVEVAVSTPWAEISKQVVARLIDLVNRFNTRVRQTQASERAAFVAGRLQEAQRELRSAEDSLENFLQRNVGWQQSPELRFRHDRLQRRVSLKQQVYTSLATRYEEARISEVKSTPVVTTVTRPRVPVRPDSGSLPLLGMFGLVFGGLIGGLWALGAEMMEKVRAKETDDYRELRSLGDDAADDLRRVRRRLRRLVGGSPDDA